jgi:DNA replication and repair protein RecF
MSLTHLNIHHLRTIACAQLTLHSRINIIYGANGSGKTSLLEAIYLLGTGHSFRTRDVISLIQMGQPALTLFARTDTQETVSIQKSIHHATQVKINQHPCQRSSDLAYFLPCQVFHHDMFHIIDEGPSVRRKLLDWGLFHVKQSYLSVWKDYYRVLKQRNALLRHQADSQAFLPWDRLLVDLAQTLDDMRAVFFQEWSAVFQSFLAQLTDTPCALRYYKGWDKKNFGTPLATILTEQHPRDLRTQYTHSGAHQADILFDTDIMSARQTLSRGQQKIILIALKLAQAHLLNKPCLYLFDDIVSELDAHHLQRLMTCLKNVKGQFFITAIDPSPITQHFSEADKVLFEMKQGCFT